MGALEVEVTRDTLETVLMVLTAVGTVGAVVVALVAPSLQERLRKRRTRPILQLVSGGSVYAAHDDPDGDTRHPITLTLTNAAGRDRAEDVEVFITVSRRLDDGSGYAGPFLAQVPAKLGHGEISSVPAGFGRRVELGALAAPTPQGPGWRGGPLLYCGTWAGDKAILLPTTGHPTDPSTEQWGVTVVVTGSNFDAQGYFGVAALSVVAWDMAGMVHGVNFSWEQALLPVVEPE